jgi:hypothetical protein
MATVPSSFASPSIAISAQMLAESGSKRPTNMLAAIRAASAVCGPSAPKKQRVILGKYEEGKVFINNDDSSNAHRTGNNGTNVQLWKFLLDILTDYKHRYQF